jgi:hypothetical protein
MKLGVLSDSHDRLPTLARALSMFRRMNVDAVIHAGDFVAPFAAKLLSPAEFPIPVHCVYGNNDGERQGLKGLLPQVVDGPLRVELGGRVIVVEHFIDWLEPAALKGAHVVITGHTHNVVNERKDGQLLLNPGECCGWVTDRCTVALLDTDTLEAEIVEITG